MKATVLADIERRIREIESQELRDALLGKAAPPVVYRASSTEVAAKDGLFTFVASEESPDRMGDVISIAGWDLAAYKHNPVFMLNHDYTIAPIGTVLDVAPNERQLIAKVKFDKSDPLAMFIQGKYERKIMRAVSVGFRPLEFEEIPGKGFHFSKQELLELSAVSIPAHPNAIAKAMAGHHFQIVVPAMPGTRQKQVMDWMMAHPDGTPADDQGADWDAGAEMREADIEDMQVMAAWVDPDNAEVKQGFKLPHHRASGEHPVVFRAVAAAIAVLNGGRGGADIPDSDRQGVYDHLARHMQDDFDAEAPELRSLEAMMPDDINPEEGDDMAPEWAAAIIERLDAIQEMLERLSPAEGEDDLEMSEQEAEKLLTAIRAFREK